MHVHQRAVHRGHLLRIAGRVHGVKGQVLKASPQPGQQVAAAAGHTGHHIVGQTIRQQLHQAAFRVFTVMHGHAGAGIQAGAVQVLYSGGIRHIAKPRDILYLQYALVFIG